jgi:hypothetical protein
VAHANARLTPAGRLLLCQRVAAGRPVAHVASEIGISRTCAYRWWAPLPAARPGRPARPAQHRPHASQAPAHQRRGRDRAATPGPQARPGTDRGAGRPAGLHRPPRPCRLGLNRLAVMDRPTGRVIRRYERAHPGELLHLDVKKLGRLRPGGGHRVHGRASAQHRVRTARPGSGPGYDYVHAAVDDHSRLAYVEVSWPTSGARPARGSCAAPRRSSPPTASPSSAC